VTVGRPHWHTSPLTARVYRQAHVAAERNGASDSPAFSAAAAFGRGSEDPAGGTDSSGIAGRDTTPGRALLVSETGRGAAEMVLRFQRVGSIALFEAMVDRGSVLLKSMSTRRLLGGVLGDVRVVEDDLRPLLGERSDWGQMEPFYGEAKNKLRALVKLLTLGSKSVEQVQVISCDGLAVEVVSHGALQRVELRKSLHWRAWGYLSAYFVARGPLNLASSRLVAHLRNGVPCEGSTLDPDVGDVLCFAPADRAAYLLVAAFDRLPDNAERLTWMHRQRFSPQVLDEARRFNGFLQSLPTTEERVHARFQRLRESAVVQDFLGLAEADDIWREVLLTLEPCAEKLYGAAAQAGGRFEGIEVSVNVLQVFGMLLVILSLASVSTEVIKQGQLQAASHLPLYTTCADRPSGAECSSAAGP